MSDRLPAHVETRRLLLRQPMTSDVADIVRELGRWNVASRLGAVPYPYLPLHAWSWLGRQRKHRETGRDLAFIIALKDRPTRVAGGIGAHHVDGQRPVVGYWLAEPFWGRGLMGEAVEALLRAVFALQPAATPIATSQVNNIGSRRVLEKCGFRRLPGRVMLSCAARGRKVACVRYMKRSGTALS
ncbi:MAG: GNAT family N-acetyltransferase [Hyphomicrobiaceae bacterium]